MRAFWVDPQTCIPRGPHDMRVFELAALARAALPPARRTVAPRLQITDILINVFGRRAIHAGQWGMRQHNDSFCTLVPALDVERHGATRYLWGMGGAEGCRRCVIPASGWIVEGKRGELLACRPEEQPVLMAGIYQEIGGRSGGPPENVSFLILTRPLRAPAGGKSGEVPLALPERSYDHWLSDKAGYAADFLSGPGGERNQRIDVRAIGAKK